MTIIPLDYDMNFGLRVVICRNSEDVCSGSDGIPVEFRDDAAQSAEMTANRAVSNILGYLPESDGLFQNWNGGKLYRKNLGYGWCFISAWTRDWDEDEGFSEWSWLSDENAPDWLKELASMVAESASQAMSKALDDFETSLTKEHEQE